MRSNESRSIPTPTAYRASVTADVCVPVLQAAAIGLVAVLAGAGAAWMLGAALALAARIGAGAGILALTLCVVSFILAHRRRITADVDVMWERLRLAEPGPAPVEPTWRVIRPYDARPMIAATVDHAVQSIEPEVDARIRELYTFITRTWPTGSVSRAHCRDLGFTRATWERLVGGQRNRRGRESGRGLLDRAGVVQRTANGWEICADLRRALSWNDDLRAYAEAKAQMVTLGTGRTGRAGTGTGMRPRRPSGQ